MQTTTNVIEYWNAFSPYMDYLENVFGINSDNLDLVIPLIQSPVLVVGAGQGLLVSELLRKGFTVEGIDISPEMVAAAEKRRGIKLFLGNANHMPFENGQFKTSIIATGVIDFIEDLNQIGAIINEVRRVTDAQGMILAALVGVTPQLEKLAEYIGVMSDNKIHIRKLMQIVYGPQIPPKAVLAIIRKDPNKSVLGLLSRAIKAFLSMRKRASMRVKAAKKLRADVKRGKISDPKSLFDYVPEFLFVRDKKRIEELFANLGFLPRCIYVFDNCKIVQL